MPIHNYPMSKELTSQLANLFASIYTKHISDVRKYILSMIHDEMAAEDMAHDIFERIAQIDVISEDTILALMLRMAKQRVIDHYRHLAIVRRVTKEVSATTFAFDTKGADSTIHLRQIRSLEVQAVSLLSPKEQAVYKLWRRGDKTFKEIALRLNINHRTIERQIYLSRKKVTAYIQQAI